MRTQDLAAAPVVTLRDYIDIISRRRRLIGALIAASTLIAVFYTLFQTPRYSARTLVVLSPALIDPTEVVARPDLLINMSTEIEIASSVGVVELAAQRSGAGVVARELRERVNVTEVPDSLILRFTVVDSDPDRAASFANEIAQAYLDWKEDGIERVSGEAYVAVQQQAVQLESRLAELETRLAGTDPNSNAFQVAQTDRNFLARELATARRRLGQAAQLRTSGGEILDRADPPKSAISPNLRINLITGLAFGALVGLLTALVRERTDDRVVPRRDSLELLGMSVLGTVPRPRGESLVVAGGTEAEANRRLSSNILVLAQAQGAKVLLVTSPNVGSVSPSIAGQIAATAARTSKRVLIVSANLRNSELARTLSVEHSPGLVGVLIGDVELAGAIRRTPRFPHLDVLLAGRPVVQPSELLQTAAFRFFVGNARDDYDFVVIEAPAVNEFADALAIGPVVDATVLTVEDGRSTKADVEYAKGQLERAGSILLGTVRVIDRNDSPSSLGDSARFALQR